MCATDFPFMRQMLTSVQGCQREAEGQGEELVWKYAHAPYHSTRTNRLVLLHAPPSHCFFWNDQTGLTA
jgi:hypothetical protein